MLKRLLSLFVILSVFVQGAVICEASTEKINSENDVHIYSTKYELNGLFTKSKTVKKTYAKKEDIPAGIYYEEYIGGHMYGGTLLFTGDISVLQYGVLEATFKGELSKID